MGDISPNDEVIERAPVLAADRAGWTVTQLRIEIQIRNSQRPKLGELYPHFSGARERVGAGGVATSTKTRIVVPDNKEHDGPTLEAALAADDLYAEWFWAAKQAGINVQTQPYPGDDWKSNPSALHVPWGLSR